MEPRMLEGLRELIEKHAPVGREAIRVERLLDWARSDDERGEAVSVASEFLKLLSSRLRREIREIEEALPAALKEGFIPDDHGVLKAWIRRAERALPSARGEEGFQAFRRLMLGFLGLLQEHVRKGGEEPFRRQVRGEGVPPPSRR